MITYLYAHNSNYIIIIIIKMSTGPSYVLLYNIMQYFSIVCREIIIIIFYNIIRIVNLKVPYNNKSLQIRAETNPASLTSFGLYLYNIINIIIIINYY